VFCRVYAALLDYFKALMTPYMSFMIQAFTDLLESFTESEEPDPELWGSLVQALGKSFEVDEAGMFDLFFILSLSQSALHSKIAFWREDRLKQISAPLISQIPVVCNSFTGIDGEADRRSLLSHALCALAGAVSEDYDERGGGSGGALLKSLNLGILMQTRSEDAKQRIFSVQSATELWRTNGIKLVGFVAETSTFIAELAEDDNDTVVKETRRFKKAVEDVGGPIDGL
jgi:U3 small nucleolar RNA-associated protein 10